MVDNIKYLRICLLIIKVDYQLQMHRCIAVLSGHTAELSACCFDFHCRTIASSSLDGTAKLWDTRKISGCRNTILGHTDEVVVFYSTFLDLILV